MISIPYDTCCADLGFLSYLAEREDFAALGQLLRNPFMARSTVLSGASEKSFSNESAAIKNFLPPESGLAELYDLHLITHCLLFQETVPEWAFHRATENVDMDWLFSGVSPGRLMAGCWAAVPVLVVLDQGELVYFIAGAIRKTPASLLWPHWVETVLDDAAKNAVRLAAASVPCAPESDFFCYPLTVASPTPQICGASLGLPLAIGFYTTGAGKPLSKDIGASGVLAENGKLDPVKQLDRKAACLRERGFRLFLYPSMNRRLVSGSEMEMLPVDDLKEAFMFTGLYEPGNSRSLILLADMVKDPAAFIGALDRIDPTWIDWASREGRWQAVVDGLVDCAGLFSAYVDKIQRLQREWKLDAAAAAAGLVSTDMLTQAEKKYPLAAFRFCTQRLALANHQGDVIQAECWAETAERLFDRALKGDIDACADFINNRFVTRHNRYSFVPEFPGVRPAVLLCLERRYRAQCEGGCSSDRVLGELYGTIAQNFGFCGPIHLDRCEEYAVRAAGAFGGGDVPEFDAEMRRQSAYLMYAYLDAGKMEKARNALFNYLEIEDWDGLWKRIERNVLTLWHYTALERYLADCALPKVTGAYYNWMAQSVDDAIQPGHPWQLRAYNLGRIACALDKLAAARGLFTKSLDICLFEKIGPTVSVMALLPLSGLEHIGALPGDEKEILKRIKTDAAGLNGAYFKMLEIMDAPEIFQTLWQHPGKLFPFSYH